MGTHVDILGTYRSWTDGATPIDALLAVHIICDLHPSDTAHAASIHRGGNPVRKDDERRG